MFTLRPLSLVTISCIFLVAPSPSTRPETDVGYRVVHTAASYPQLEERLKAAIAKNAMNLVNRASASDGAKGRGLAIRGDAVIGVFRNDFAVRMLEANVDAGIEAPVRFHLVEEADGTASIRFYLPSAVFLSLSW
jgi:uncharacterized protein (DUF302 family)